MKQVKVSVIAANYNNAEYLEEFVASILAGLALPEKIIITDDASTDRSREILEKLTVEYPVLEVIYFSNNQGVANARNAAISLVKTKYLAIADVDDLFHPDRIQQQFNYLEKNPEVDILGSNCRYFNSKQRQSINNSNFPLNHAAIVEQFKQANNGVLNGTVLGKTKIFQKFLYDQNTVWAEDYDLFSRILQNGHTFAALPEALMKVRIHDSSQTANLKLETIQKIYQLRKKHFGIDYSPAECETEFKHLFYYRRYLSGTNLSKYFHLLMSVFYAPEKLLKRLRLCRR